MNRTKLIKGKNLYFISRIQRDGLSVVPVEANNDMHNLDETVFHINCLSITNGTYIACEFNSFVVKIKNESYEKLF